MAPAGTGVADQELVADELAASVGQDGWSSMPALIDCGRPNEVVRPKNKPTEHHDPAGSAPVADLLCPREEKGTMHN